MAGCRGCRAARLELFKFSMIRHESNPRSWNSIVVVHKDRMTLAEGQKGSQRPDSQTHHCVALVEGEFTLAPIHMDLGNRLSVISNEVEMMEK